MKRLSHLITELRRRRVFRVAAIYAVTAWAILEVSATVFEILELPVWAGKLILALLAIGFILAVALSWAFEVTPDGIRADVRLPRRRHYVAGVVAVLLVIAAVVFSDIGLRERDTVATSSDRVAVFPFVVHGSEDMSYLREGLAELVGRNLDGAGQMHSVDAARVFRAWNEAVPSPPTVDQSAAMAADIGAGLFVVGTITEAYNRLRVRATLYEVGDSVRAIGATGEIEADASELFAIADRATAELIALRFGSASRRFAWTASGTTSSLTALKHFLLAEQQLRATAYDNAIAGFQEAVRVDSTFALAHYRLAVSVGLSNRYGAASDAIDRALRHADRLSERDLSLLHAYDAYRRGHADEAEQRYRSILRDYPDDVEARFQLANVLYRYNPLRGRRIAEAVPEFESVMLADPQFLCPI